jgi:phospholipid/cholesterol/gamma-HCH transport system permease protein
MATWEFSNEAGRGVIALSGAWLARGGEARTPQVGRLCRGAAVQRLSFEVSRLGEWDTLLVAFLWDIKRAAVAAGVILDDAALPESAKQLLRLLPSSSSDAGLIHDQIAIFNALGGGWQSEGPMKP